MEFGDRQAFGKLLRACGEIEGLERVRFTSPHPAEFTDDVIAAMAETPNVMPQLHMPLQSGSDRVLKAMRRSYRREKYLGIIDRVRAAMPDAAITTDIIVGFPGETEDDFEQTLDGRRARRGSRRLHLPVLQAPRHPGRDAARPGRPAVVQDRYERLVAVVDEIAWAENKAQVGRRVELMVAEGEGRKDAATHRLSGRAPDNRLVHFTRGPRQPRSAPATWSPSRSPTPRRTTWSPTARSAVRRTRSGDAWEARTAGADARAASASACPRSVCPRRCRPTRPAVPLVEEGALRPCGHRCSGVLVGLVLRPRVQARIAGDRRDARRAGLSSQPATAPAARPCQRERLRCP